ncbi:MAG TPA: ABC transporter substrate-binding protein [Bosea sp. (in: a-proteobacteria)]|jgi:putative ABC transport system substrate-binding protein|nr:ABC transporter substrate-binding protein [Bosea sp. (in: a-proteobacteria)]
MHRRSLLVALATCGLALSGRAARSAEPAKRISIIVGVPLDHPVVSARIAELYRLLGERGWIDGKNLRISWRYRGPSGAELARAAAEVVRETPDIIVVGSSAETAAVLAETRRIPVLFSTASDPVGSGFVRSLERPEGNATGFSNNDPAMAEKWVELLTEIAPTTRRIGVVFNPASTPAAGKTYLARLQATTPAGEPAFEIIHVMEPSAIDGAIAGFASKGAGGGLVFLPDSFTYRNAALCTAAAARLGLPAVYPFDAFTLQGGLMSYAGAREETAEMVASYIDLILRGADVAELPVQFSRSFELVINEKAAAALGLSLPASLRIRAQRILS